MFTGKDPKLIPFLGIPLLLMIGGILSCGKEGPRFHHLDKGLAFRRVTLGKKGAPIQVGDGVGFVYRFTPLKAPDKTLLKDTSYLLLDHPDAGLTRALKTMREGDSSIFKLKSIGVLGDQFPSVKQRLPDRYEGLRMELRLLDRRDPSALMQWKEKKDPELLDRARWKEWKRIQEFVKGLSPHPEKHFVDGIYFFPVRKGKGAPVRPGRRISIHYKGYLPDSSCFDNSYARGEPLRFRYGDPEQVVRGLEIALKYMRKGGKAKVVIPSYLAFGKKGGETGILPPHTFVYYKIEVVDVKIS